MLLFRYSNEWMASQAHSGGSQYPTCGCSVIWIAKNYGFMLSTFKSLKGGYLVCGLLSCDYSCNPWTNLSHD